MNGRGTGVQNLARIHVFFFTFCKSELVGRFMNSSSVPIFCVLKIRGLFKDAVELTRKFIIS